VLHVRSCTAGCFIIWTWKVGHVLLFRAKI
jgi:hypothetical protein